MRKQINLAIAFLSLCPLTASATYIGSGQMAIDYAAPITYTTTHGYYADYDIGSYDPNLDKIINFDPSYEVFCVENEPLISPTNYDFFTSDGVGVSGLELLNNWTTNYQEVTWIANWATTDETYGSFSLDEKKAIGQVAIWNILNVLSIPSADTYGAETSAITSLYTTAGDQAAYVDDWLLAVSFQEDGPDGQNYLVQASPVPEPATMLLFGTGLIGLAGAARRRKNS